MAAIHEKYLHFSLLQNSSRPAVTLSAACVSANCQNVPCSPDRYSAYCHISGPSPKQLPKIAIYGSRAMESADMGMIRSTLSTCHDDILLPNKFRHTKLEQTLLLYKIGKNK